MPLIEENYHYWNSNFSWEYHGEEWSTSWGNSKLQWIGTLLPRIINYIPTGQILEIAPGMGRWTQYLFGLCEKLTVVDLSDKCIQACKERFAHVDHIEYFVNDGLSLQMVEDNCIDFVFSFDSLVHAEVDVLRSYITEFSRILKPNGLCFIHHSNLGSYANNINDDYDSIIQNIRNKAAIGNEININSRWRAKTVGHKKVSSICDEVGLKCITQELINWGNPPNVLIDAISVIARKNQFLHLESSIYENNDFMVAAKVLRGIYNSYRLY